MEGAGHMLQEFHGRLLRLVCSRTGMHFEGLAAAAGWLARHGCRGKEANKLLKSLRQMDMVAAWVRHVTAPKCDGLVASVGQRLDLAGFAVKPLVAAEVDAACLCGACEPRWSRSGWLCPGGSCDPKAARCTLQDQEWADADTGTKAVFGIIEAAVSQRGEEFVKMGGAVFQLNVGQESLSLDFLEGCGSTRRGGGGQADVTFEMMEDDFLALAAGRLNGAQAFKLGKMVILGDFMLAQRLGPILESAMGCRQVARSQDVVSTQGVVFAAKAAEKAGWPGVLPL